MLSTGEREYLRQIPLFASLDEEALEPLGNPAIVQRYDRGEVIVVEGEREGSLRYVRTGLVKLATTSVDGREQILRLVPAGQTFNLVASLDGQPSAATATALDPTTIYAIHRKVLTKLLTERPTVAQAALQALAADTRDMIALAKDLALYHVSERVARLLLDQERCSCERCRHHYMTQQEMAAIVGTAREMVGRALHEFQAANIIDLHHGHVVIRDPDRLRMIAREHVNTRSRTRQKLTLSQHSEQEQPHTTAHDTQASAAPERHERDDG